MNQFGITHWSQPLPLAELAQVMKPYGFTGIALQFGDDYKENSVFDPAVRAEALRVKETYGIEFPSMGINIFCNINACDPESFDLACGILADAVYAAKETGVPILQVPAFFKSRIHNAEDLANTAAVFRAACIAAKPYDVMITSENALTVAENEAFVKAVGCENFGLYFDTQNPVSFAGYNATEQVAPLLPYIAQIHVKDCNDEGPTLLGKGNTGFFETMAEFKKGGYDAWMVSETSYNKLLLQPDATLESLLMQDAKTITDLIG